MESTCYNISRLKQITSNHTSSAHCKKWQCCTAHITVDNFKIAEKLIIGEVQRETYSEEIACLLKKRNVSKTSKIVSLSPFIDGDGLLCVGGRLRRSTITPYEKHPLIIPGQHHISTLLVRRCHEDVQHQGRHLTEGAIRNAGYRITGSKRLVSTIIHSCVKYRKLRGGTQQQQMADLPLDRLEPSPPFTYVGVDTFGPWEVTSRRTRGGKTQSKRWAILFTCLACRAIHIEVVDEMSSSSFINAIRRFVSIRGPVKEFRSNKSTNFVGTTNDLKIDAIHVEDREVLEFLEQKRTTWIFNPPHATHMGGACMGENDRNNSAHPRFHDDGPWIKSTYSRRSNNIYGGSLRLINSRPLVPVSAELDNPEILTPSTLLTQKIAPDVPEFRS